MRIANKDTHAVNPDGARVKVDSGDPLPTGFTPVTPADFDGADDPAPSRVSSAATHVFEVTDLPIPAGTDWSVTLHEIGSLTVHWWEKLIFKLYVELAEPPADFLTLGITDTLDRSAANYVAAAGATPGSQIWDYATNALAQGSSSPPGSLANFLHQEDVLTGSQGALFPDQAVAPPASQLLHVVLGTNSPTTADITVVRARAAVLVL